MAERSRTKSSAAEGTIHFVSLGCPKNRVDTEVMLGVSDGAGYRLVPDAADADVIVVNTCGFIEAAKQESIETILDLSRHKQDGRCSRLVVAGCLSQRYPDQLASEMPEVDHFLGSSDMLKLGRLLKRSEKSERMLVGNPADYVFKQSDPRTLSQGTHSAYVKIAEGCSRKCSFCAIPSFRGTQRSRPLEDVVAEVTRLVAQGAMEINIISQDTISYGRDLSPKQSLAALTRALCEIDGLRWLRLFYLYPEKMTDELFDLFSSQPKLVPYVDMPLQHASDAMLTRMRRGHGGDRQRQIVERLRSRIPNLTFRTAFIVGHPGETDADFDELLEFVKWAQFERLGVFKYSHEDGTHSGSMDELVDAKTAERRYRKLMSTQRVISRKKAKAMRGREIDVLVEGVSEESEFLLEGRHPGQAPDIDGKVFLSNGTAPRGSIVRARVVDSSDYDLVAEFDTDSPIVTPRKASKASMRLPLAR